ncbi:hypothetical protein [Xenorhabdus taiwanensis]|uniref:Phosphatidylinositol diacylglycerol-lyase n=1 Tax=Xenorhabdus taiwanensis TaxID=3085177 RepID=A0ABM8JR30_9GAMM|nr:hypothetical protein TCT1_00720 [Xenorhabdus sp. TCT-1]
MSQYSDVMLINSTNSDWKITSVSSKLMQIQDIPYPIKSRFCQHFNISSLNGLDIKNCNFDAAFQIMDSVNSTFRVRGRYKDELGRFDVEVYLENLETHKHKKGSAVSLGWVQSGKTYLFLIGDVGNYIGPNINTESWMQEHLNILGNHSLKEICISGSHDAGMSVSTWSTHLASECNTLTQSNNILNQLKLGIRYFDIRPVLSDKNFFTGHYKKLGFFWEGANGESIDSIIDEINSFMESNNELIMIKLSHSLNLDVGFFKTYSHFNKDQWFDLFDKLSTIKNLYYHNGIGKVSDSTINTLTANGTRSAVLFFVEDKESNIDLGEYEDAGFFLLSELNMYHKYSNTNDINVMSKDQLKKMHDHAPQQYFELEWTLTQDAIQAVSCPTTIGFSIKELADIANREFIELLYPNIKKKEYPNVILVDNVKDIAVTTLALAINWIVL